MFGKQLYARHLLIIIYTAQQLVVFASDYRIQLYALAGATEPGLYPRPAIDPALTLGTA